MENCIICNQQTKIIYKVKNYNLLKCKSCGFIHIDKQPSGAELDEIYGFTYFNHNKYKDLSALKAENERRIGLIEQHKKITKDKNLLDVGCAGGEFINTFHQKFSENDIKGFDFSEQAIDKAKKSFPHLKNNFFVGNSEDFFENNLYDVIVLWDVIEHVWNPTEVIENQVKLLKQDGLIFFSTPYINANFAKLMGKFWPFMTPPEHMSFLTKKSIEKIALKLNLNLVHWQSKGKKVNVVFIFYKLRRIFPKIIPQKLIDFLGKTFLNKISIYVPTNDIQYFIFSKK